MKKFLLILALLLPINSLAETPKMGFIVPLTGPAVLMGDSLRGVVELATPKNFTSVFEDDKCNGKDALSAYLKLRNEGVRAFYMACSGSILAVAPLAKRNGDLILTTYAGSSRIRETGDEVIRLNPDAISVADGVAKLLDKSQLPTAILFEEQEYATSLADRLQHLLGGNVVAKVSYQPNSPSFNAEILRIRQKDPRSIVVVPVGDGAARIIFKELARNGVMVPVFGEVNFCDFPFKPAEFGLHGRCVSAKFEGADFREFLSNFRKASGREPAYPFYDAMAFDLLRFLDRDALLSKGVESTKRELLAGFEGSFMTYKLTSSGEPEDSSSYLVTTEF